MPVLRIYEVNVRFRPGQEGQEDKDGDGDGDAPGACH